MTLTKKRIILCADDFGLSEGISHAIVSLFETDRISAAGCMTTTSRWKEDAALLKPYHDNKDIGLHFNLTEGRALTANPANIRENAFTRLSLLIPQALFGQVNENQIELELNAQLDAFEACTGRQPDFIDGHQHVHHLPIVSRVVMKVFRERLDNQKCYIRSVYPFIPDENPFLSKGSIKKWVIYLTGAKKMRKLVERSSIPSNSCFGGLYDFSRAGKFPGLLQTWLKKAQDHALIMCHPGKNVDRNDPLRHSRKKEYCWLQSEEFARFCQQEHIIISRFHT